MGIRIKEISVMEFDKNFDKEKYSKYIFSYKSQKDAEYRNLTFNISFDDMTIMYNPNRIFLHSGKSFTNNIVFEGVKYISVDTGEVYDTIDIVCVDFFNNTNNVIFSVLAEKKY